MKLCSYIHAGKRGFGVVLDDMVIAGLAGGLGDGGPTSLDLAIDALAEETLSLEDLSEAAARSTNRIALDDPDLRWLPPVVRPSKVIGVAMNNRQMQDLAFRKSDVPMFFLKPPSALTGHKEPLHMRRDFGITHPEPELAVVIGKRAKNVDEAHALDVVLGYTIINDITSPDLKARDSIELIAPPKIAAGLGEIDWREHLTEDHRSRLYYTYHALSKGCDSFGPIGPWIVTKDDLPDPNRLDINGFWEDVHMCVDNTANLTFTVQKVIAHISRYTKSPGS